jgi:hypothetical protein
MGGRAAMPGNGQWFEETDREGVAFEYDVIEMKATSVGGVRANHGPPCSPCNILFVPFEGTQFWSRTPTRSMQACERPGLGHSVSNQF